MRNVQKFATRIFEMTIWVGLENLTKSILEYGSGPGTKNSWTQRALSVGSRYWLVLNPYPL